MGIDIWQGVMTSNNTPELIKKYGGQISFMGISTVASSIFRHGHAVLMQADTDCLDCSSLLLSEKVLG